jgi:acyl carrier protein
MSNVDDLSRELRELLVQELSLNVDPETLPIDQPLLDGSRSAGPVAIDSLDMLQLVLTIEDRYAVQLPEDARELSVIFNTIQSLAENVARLRQPAAQGA